MPQQQDGYFEQTYQAPWKGVNVSLPENKIDPTFTPDAANWIPRSGELRSRPRFSPLIGNLPDRSSITGHTAFVDSNNVVHTVAISSTGLWQLNSTWRKNPRKQWSLVARFPFEDDYPAFTVVNTQEFKNLLFFVNGTNDLWSWDGITPNSLNLLPGLQSAAVIDIANNLTAGGFFLGELDSRLILLNTVEEQANPLGPTFPKINTNYPQRVRWCASGLPFYDPVNATGGWDPTVDVGAGFNDEIDVPDAITGFLTIGRTGFIFRVNGITELIPISTGLLPFDFNHLWASDRGIGNIYAFTIAGYGPVGMFISTDEIYQISIGGFKKVGGVARNRIYEDLALAVRDPIGSLFPSYRDKYPYLTYMLSIPIAGGKTKLWCYFVEDECWFPWGTINGYITGKVRMVPTI